MIYAGDLRPIKMNFLLSAISCMHPNYLWQVLYCISFKVIIACPTRSYLMFFRISSCRALTLPCVVDNNRNLTLCEDHGQNRSIFALHRTVNLTHWMQGIQMTKMGTSVLYCSPCWRRSLTAPAVPTCCQKGDILYIFILVE